PLRLSWSRFATRKLEHPVNHPNWTRPGFSEAAARCTSAHPRSRIRAGTHRRPAKSVPDTKRVLTRSRVTPEGAAEGGAEDIGSFKTRPGGRSAADRLG